MRESLHDVFGSMNKPSDAPSLLAAWREQHNGDPRIIKSIYEPSVQADLGGQAFVRLIEMEDDTRLLASTPRDAFLSMPFEEALAFWRARGGSEEQLQLVLRGYRENAEGASSLMLDAVSRRAIAEMERAIEQGVSLRDFANSINDEAANFGLGPVSPSYLENVYRTNVSVAYGAGRYTQLIDPVVMAARPYREYMTVGDGRVRSSHAALAGLVFLAESSDWRRIAPPNGYQCRCAMVSRSRKQFAELRLVLSSGVPLDYVAEPDFNAPPDQLAA